jgi:hypothetical protein
VPKVIGEVKHVVGPDRSTVGVGEADVLAPRAQEFPVPIKHDDRVSAARKNVDIVLAVDADGSAVAIGVAGW